MIRRLTVCILLAAAVCAAADNNRDLQELQRDVAQLQEMVKNLQSGLDQRFATLATQIQGIGQSADKVNAAVTALEKNLGQVGPSLATQGTRIDQATSTLNTLQQAMTDLTTAVNKMQNQLLDVSNAVKVMSAPAAPPPGEAKVPAADLLNNADGDKAASSIWRSKNIRIT
jgi:septal ring factor EnvC (AmiA/AmiB activator)